jgi:PilZ domain
VTDRFVWANFTIELQGFLNFYMEQKRKYQRVPLRCAVILWNPRAGTVTQAETENISCEGFYFLCGTEYAPGEQLEATVQVPAWDSSRDDPFSVSLQCLVEVMWTKARQQRGEYGIGCRIHSYTVLARRPRKRTRVSGA